MMSWKKNVFSYILWAISTIAVGIGLFSFAAFWGVTKQYAFWTIMAICGAVLISCAGIAIVGHKFGGDLSERIRRKGNSAYVLEYIVFLGLLGLSIYFTIINMPEAFQNEYYFEHAKVSGDAPIVQWVHGASYIYLQFLRIICTFFGNNVLVCMAFQIFLYYLAMLVLYFAIRRMAGWVPAVAFWTAAMFSPFLKNELTSFSPTILYLLLFAIVSHFVAACMHARRKGFIRFLLTGIIIALIGYLDITGFVLFLVLCTSAFLKKEQVYETISYKIGRFLFSLIGLTVGFFGSVFADAYLSGKIFGNVLDSWWSLYHPKMAVIPTVIYESSKYLDLLFIFVGLGLGVFSFICRKRYERSSWLILPIAGLMLMQSFQMTLEEMNGSYLLYILVVSLAGVGAGDIFEGGAACGGAETPPEDTIPMTEIVDLESTEISIEPQENETEVDSIEDAAEDTSQNVEEIEKKVVETVEAPQPVKLLDNPLPLPKKHVPKSMDYDIEISEDDDFDI